MSKKPTYEELKQRIRSLEQTENRRKKAEKALQASENRFRTIFEKAAVGVAQTESKTGKLMFINQRYADIVGYTIEEMKHLTFQKITHPDDLKKNLDNLQRLLDGEIHEFSMEKRYYHKNGSLVWANLTVSPMWKMGEAPNYHVAVVEDITERKRLQKVMHQYRRAVESSLDLMVEVDRDYTYQFVNKGYLEYHQLNEEQIIGHYFGEVVGEDYFENNLKSYLDRCLDGETIHFETVYTYRGKGTCHMEVWYFPLVEEDGAIQGVVGLARNITERKKAEKALRESEEKYKDLYDNAPDMFLSVDAKTAKILACNQTLAKKLGYTKEEIMGRPVFDLYTPDSAEYAEANVFPIFSKTGIIEGEELQLQRKDGSKIDVNLNATAVHDEKGGILYSRSVWRDITKRKQTEEALISEKLLSEEYINSLPGLFYVFDDQRFVRWNSAWNRISGYSDEELANMYGPDFFEGKDKVLIEERMRKVFTVGAAVAEVEFITKDGNRIPYYFTGLRKKLNGKDHLIGLGIDITDRRQAEEEKRKALEFASEQSKHSLIGQVAGKMAHDFNNVLMGIMGNAQLGIMDCNDETIKEKLENINEFAERGRDITNTLMSYSIDQEPKQTYFKIEDKIELVLNMLKKDMTGIKISRKYESGISELLADPGMIQDALVNIIQNSIHAMSKVKKPTLNLKVYTQNDKVYVEIKDNGCGIPKEHQDSIYSPSFTLKGSHDETGAYKSEIKGTGYGMSNVKKYIVEKHKGNIFLDSEMGKGTKITIALKIIKDHLSLNEKKEIVKSQIHGMRRILLVEDEPAIADVQYQILTKEPYNHIVSIAANGQTAIDVFNRSKFDVVSLDFMLPGNTSGLDVYKHIRENNKDIPILFISGNVEFLESMKKLKEKDSNLEHLSKPVNNLDYVNKINELAGSIT